MKFLQVVKTIASLLPALIEAIKAVEEAIPGEGKGEQKLIAVRQILESVDEFADDLGMTFQELWPTIEKVIKTLVDLFNKTGAFEEETTNKN